MRQDVTGFFTMLQGIQARARGVDSGPGRGVCGGAGRGLAECGEARVCGGAGRGLAGWGGDSGPGRGVGWGFEPGRGGGNFLG